MKSFISIILIALIPIFGMSDDGDNEPISNKPESVKDWFGNDTGMTEKEFQEHQESYIRKWFEFHKSIITLKEGLSENRIKSLEERRRQDAIVRYKQRLNLNSIPDFEQFGIEPSFYFWGYHSNSFGDFALSTTVSQLVIHAKITSSVYGRYTLKPIEILKGSFYYDEIPDSIVVSLLGEEKKDQDVIVFIGYNHAGADNRIFEKNLKNVPLTTIGVSLVIDENENVYETHTGAKNKIGTLKKICRIIRKIDKVNDTENFYKIKF